MLRRVYDWTLMTAERPWALWAMAAISFIESSVFPITPLVMVIPMILARPDRAWLIAGVCTLASVAGGVMGWMIGALLYDEIGRPVLEFYGKAEAFQQIAADFNALGTEAVLIAAITPFPYKVITIFSGVSGLSIWTLIGASLIGRGIQFFGVAAVVWYFGARAKTLIEKHMTLVATVGGVLVIGGFAAVKLLIQ